MASRRRDYGSLSPRLQELSAKTTPIEPYPVTDAITIEPPGKKRRDALNEAYATIMVCNAKTNALLRRYDPSPTAPVPPEDSGEDATEEQHAEHAALVAEYEQRVAEFDSEMIKWSARMDNLDELAENVAEEAKAATEQYNRALLGPAYDDIMMLSENWAPELWDEFLRDLNAHFGRGVNPPPDGTCRTCGQVIDQEEAGKAQSSST